MRTRIYPLALGKIIKHTLIDPNNEVAGLLVGKYINKSDVLEIWDAITGDQKSTPGFVYLHEDTIAQAAEWILRNRPGLYIVGWYHSHPGFSIFLSAIDLETQKRYQMFYPKAVALVVDPLKYSQSGRLSDLKFSVFRINKRGEVVRVPMSIGIQRHKLLESTLKGIETMELKYIDTGRDIDEYEIPVEDDLEEGRISSPLSSMVNRFNKLRKFKDKFIH
ncbi:MAG: Mov34/MPN/PAD-1 family protein [Nitrososphaeria archaeon]|nr:Mov34/MPN/PAD-1 family protein [Aigarchaeota archaeon]MCX8187458.1 Mov34/MPN/PAD-1 family protein [Nitrososphaeria archaeon]MDW8021082.1 Mov34/MPN/PAD-1 family protein [Nitrososphaerota archaeon]